MIDEWCERQIDRLCAFLPAYISPRMTRFYTTKLGWRLYLYVRSFKRSVIDAVLRIQWIEKEEPDLTEEPVPEEEEDPALQKLDPAMRQEIEAWNEEQKIWTEKAEQERRMRRTPQERLAQWWRGRHERAARREEKWAARDAQAQAKADEHMIRFIPMMDALKKSRFVFMLLFTLLAALGVIATGGGEIGYLAASCCAMWLATAFESGYQPVCGGVRQRYLSMVFLRALSFLLLLPMYFGAYVRQGVSSNVVLQSAMIVLLFAHGAFFFALIAFNGRQPLLLRALSGLLGVVPALAAAAAIALAATMLGRAMPLPAAGVIGAVGALLAFSADRLVSITELGGIRLRYTPAWIGVFMEAGYFMMLIGSWMAAA